MSNCIVVIDNFDSFTFNVVHLIRQCSGAKITVQRNNAIDEAVIKKASHLVFSPGPGLPNEAGMMPELLKRYADSKVILGICLGHQAIGEHFGGKLKQLKSVHHGVTSVMERKSDKDDFFNEIPQSCTVGRYHSWVVDEVTLPDTLRVLATDSEGTIMAMRHTVLPIFGVQFHPESILTEHGETMIKNFLSIQGA